MTTEREMPRISPEHAKLYGDPEAPDDWSMDEAMADRFAGRGTQPSTIRDPTTRKFYEAYLAAHPGAFKPKSPEVAAEARRPLAIAKETDVLTSPVTTRSKWADGHLELVFNVGPNNYAHFADMPKLVTYNDRFYFLSGWDSTTGSVTYSTRPDAFKPKIVR